MAAYWGEDGGASCEISGTSACSSTRNFWSAAGRAAPAEATEDPARAAPRAPVPVKLPA